ncbi:MAG: rod shape-determining protein RodA [Chloroflexales bacterium]|nr:rod shape-determining protein RodA [Chloroflexales bacterium]
MQSRLWREYNYVLMGCVVVLLIFGAVMVYSATLSNGPLRVLFSRHLLNIAIGIAAMAALTLLDYRHLSAFGKPFYLATVGVLAVVLVVGRISEGAQSWIELGTRTFQPSEPAKLVMIVVLAAFFARFHDHAGDLRVQLGALFLIAVPALLVLVQPDFGTTLVFGAIWLAMAWTAGLKWYHLLLLLLLAVPLCYLGWQRVLDAEQKSRLLTFYYLLTDPSLVNADEGYNIIQSLSAIGSGGTVGTGLGRGLLSQGSYIPVQYSDFIFAVVGEEMGFVGGVVLLLFQGLLLWLIISVAARARDVFGRLLVAGICGMLLCHLLVNVGMNMSIMPVTGIPLPLISYGGSFTITTLAAVGLIQSVAMRWRRISF